MYRRSLRRLADAPLALTQALLLAPMVFYRRLVSPLLPSRCRYHPTCSAYAIEAIRQVGPVRGTILAAWRVLRCNPYSLGGVDHLRDQKLFRGRLEPRGLRHDRNTLG